jgi:hypothetical protein
VSFADFFDFRFLRTSEVAKIVEECLRLTRSEGLADGRTEVFAVVDGGGEEELVLFVCGVVSVSVRRSYFTANLCGEHSN